jgi:hypothetical protein
MKEIGNETASAEAPLSEALAAESKFFQSSMCAPAEQLCRCPGAAHCSLSLLRIRFRQLGRMHYQDNKTKSDHYKSFWNEYTTAVQDIEVPLIYVCYVVSPLSSIALLSIKYFVLSHFKRTRALRNCLGLSKKEPADCEAVRVESRAR